MILKHKINGEVTTEKVSAKQAYKICSSKTKNVIHQCWEGDCPLELCNTNACPKVFDIEKKNIEDYDFIISGIEVRKESGELISLIVQDCALYNKYLEEHQDEPKVRVKK